MSISKTSVNDFFRFTSNSIENRSRSRRFLHNNQLFLSEIDEKTIIILIPEELSDARDLAEIVIRILKDNSLLLNNKILIENAIDFQNRKWTVRDLKSSEQQGLNDHLNSRLENCWKLQDAIADNNLHLFECRNHGIFTFNNCNFFNKEKKNIEIDSIIEVSSSRKREGSPDIVKRPDEVINQRPAGTIPFPFVNPGDTKKLALKEIPVDLNAPKWKTAKPGLSLFGKCCNQECEAFDQAIWISKGFNTFHLNKECVTSSCPVCCKEATEVNNCGFYECLFSIEGERKDGTSIQHLNQQVSFRDRLLSFGGNSIIMSEWRYLKIKTNFIVLSFINRDVNEDFETITKKAQKNSTDIESILGFNWDNIETPEIFGKKEAAILDHLTIPPFIIENINTDFRNERNKMSLGFILNFDWNKAEIAKILWKDEDAFISDEMRGKVNNAHSYLKETGFKLDGIKADGNCFLNAFLESYQTLQNRKIPLLDEALDKISYLRSLIAKQYESSTNGSKFPDRAKQIRLDGEWITANNEGDLLAYILSIPIRVLTVEAKGISDLLTFPEREKAPQNWDTILQIEKPKNYIFIVDFGGHFLYASPLATATPLIN